MPLNVFGSSTSGKNKNKNDTFFYFYKNITRELITLLENYLQ